MTNTKRPANDDGAHDGAASLVDDLIDEIAHEDAAAAAQHPSAAAHRLAAEGRAMIARALAQQDVGGPSNPAIDIAALARAADGDADASEGSLRRPDPERHAELSPDDDG